METPALPAVTVALISVTSSSISATAKLAEPSAPPIIATDPISASAGAAAIIALSASAPARASRRYNFLCMDRSSSFISTFIIYACPAYYQWQRIKV